MGKELILPPEGEAHEIPLREALEERYLAYALSTIMNRALPTRATASPAPAHPLRMRISPRSRRRAEEIRQDRRRGDGLFHPHGDQAIYTRWCGWRKFCLRYPLIDGQGNFGNVDGDNPAAMRYTSAPDRRRAPAARRHRRMRSIFANLRRQRSRPVVLPGIPNLLANGSQGIAVGMATSIPPHNVAELCDAALFLIDNPNARSRTLLEIRSGPISQSAVDVDTRETIAGPTQPDAAAFSAGTLALRRPGAAPIRSL